MTKQEKSCLEHFRTSSNTLREFIAEFIGTFILTLCGNAIGASLTFGRVEGVSVVMGPLGWGFAVAIAIYISGGVSGAHLNPAVTLGLASVGKLPWCKIGHYMLAQYLGAFTSSAVLFGVYLDAMNQYDGGNRQIVPNANATSHIFACYPQPHVTTLTCFGDQILTTAVLLMAILGITDERNQKVPPGTQPMAVGFTLSCILIGFGYNCGAPMNPARDLAPRAFTALAGWGEGVFSFRDYNWFWVPIVGPYLGGIVGAWIYRLTVELHWPPVQDEYPCRQPWKSHLISPIGSESVFPHGSSKNSTTHDLKSPS